MIKKKKDEYEIIKKKKYLEGKFYHFYKKQQTPLHQEKFFQHTLY